MTKHSTKVGQYVTSLILHLVYIVNFINMAPFQITKFNHSLKSFSTKNKTFSLKRKRSKIIYSKLASSLSMDI